MTGFNGLERSREGSAVGRKGDLDGIAISLQISLWLILLLLLFAFLTGRRRDSVQTNGKFGLLSSRSLGRTLFTLERTTLLFNPNLATAPSIDRYSSTPLN